MKWVICLSIGSGDDASKGNSDSCIWGDSLSTELDCIDDRMGLIDSVSTLRSLEKECMLTGGRLARAFWVANRRWLDTSSRFFKIRNHLKEILDLNNNKKKKQSRLIQIWNSPFSCILRRERQPQENSLLLEYHIEHVLLTWQNREKEIDLMRRKLFNRPLAACC